MIALLLGVLLLAGNAFFVAAEFAVISARRSQLEPLANAGNRRAKLTIEALERVSEMLACAQFGITLCSLGLGAVAEPALARLIQDPFIALGFNPSLVHLVAMGLALTIVVFFHVVIGEMVPKNLALANPSTLALALGPMLMAVAKITGPVTTVMNAIANGCLRLFGVEPKAEVSSAFTAEEVQSIVAESSRSGLLHGNDDLITGALEFTDQVVGDLMVPWDTMTTVVAGATPQHVEDLVRATGFSRFPVVGEDHTIVGYLHLKDILYADDHRHHEPIPNKRIRSLVTVFSSDEAEDALAQMQRSGAHLARVVDRAGQTLGVLFLEDILEVLVGEIDDASRLHAVKDQHPG